MREIKIKGEVIPERRLEEERRDAGTEGRQQIPDRRLLMECPGRVVGRADQSNS